MDLEYLIESPRMYLPIRVIRIWNYDISNSDKVSECSRKWILSPLLNLGYNLEKICLCTAFV